MKAIKTDQSNVNLTLPGGTAANDLPAERCRFIDPDTGDDHPGFESVWVPDDDEREAMFTGAPVILRIWGESHPPVAVRVPEVPPQRAGLTRDHADRAAGALISLLEEHGFLSRPVTQIAGDVLPLWDRAIRETSQGATEVERFIADVQAAAEDRQSDDGQDGDPC